MLDDLARNDSIEAVTGQIDFIGESTNNALIDVWVEAFEPAPERNQDRQCVPPSIAI